MDKNSKQLNKEVWLEINEKIIKADINGDFLIVLTNFGKLLYKNYLNVLEGWKLASIVSETEK